MEPLDLEFIDPVLTEGLIESPFIDAFYMWTADAKGIRRRALADFDRPAPEPGQRPQRFREAPDGGGPCCRSSRALHDEARHRGLHDRI
jgi:hypothetical protein